MQHAEQCSMLNHLGFVLARCCQTGCRKRKAAAACVVAAPPGLQDTCERHSWQPDRVWSGGGRARHVGPCTCPYCLDEACDACMHVVCAADWQGLLLLARASSMVLQRMLNKERVLPHQGCKCKQDWRCLLLKHNRGDGSVDAWATAAPAAAFFGPGFFTHDAAEEAEPCAAPPASAAAAASRACTPTAPAACH